MIEPTLRPELTASDALRMVAALRKVDRTVVLPADAEPLASTILAVLRDIPVEIEDLIRPCSQPYSHAQHSYGFVCPGFPPALEPGCVCPGDGYSPACPLHSEHLYDPSTNMWLKRTDLIFYDDADQHERDSVRIASREAYARGYDDARSGRQNRPGGQTT